MNCYNLRIIGGKKLICRLLKILPNMLRVKSKHMSNDDYLQEMSKLFSEKKKIGKKHFYMLSAEMFFQHHKRSKQVYLQMSKFAF